MPAFPLGRVAGATSIGFRIHHGQQQFEIVPAGSTPRRKPSKVGDAVTPPRPWTSVFLSRFWVSKWHPKILQWHPKFWKPRYGFALYWSKRFEESMFSRTWPLQQTAATSKDDTIIMAQKLEAKILSLVSVHCHAHRLASASYYTAADFYSMVYATAKALSCNYESVLLFHRCDRLAWRCNHASGYNENKRSVVAAPMQNKVVAEWGNSES